MSQAGWTKETLQKFFGWNFESIKDRTCTVCADHLNGFRVQSICLIALEELKDGVLHRTRCGWCCRKPEVKVPFHLALVISRVRHEILEKHGTFFSSISEMTEETEGLGRHNATSTGDSLQSLANVCFPKAKDLVIYTWKRLTLRKNTADSEPTDADSDSDELAVSFSKGDVMYLRC